MRALLVSILIALAGLIAGPGAAQEVAGLGRFMSAGAGAVSGSAPSTTPVLSAAPTISPAPLVTQGPATTWTGNTVSISNGTWSNCAPCSYTYQWWIGYGSRNGLMTYASTTNSYTVPTSTTGSISPQANTLVWATVTATNSAGSAMSATIPARVQTSGMSGNPVVVTPPVIEKCADETSACTNPVPITNTLGVGDWITISSPGTYSNAPGWALSSTTPYGWSFQSEATGGNAVNLMTRNQTIQITASMQKSDGTYVSYQNGMIAGTVTIHDSLGQYTEYSTYQGSIQANTTTVIPAPVPASTLPTFVTLPSTAGGTYVGTTLQYQGLDNAPWTAYPPKATYQWYYCNSACTAPSAPGVLLSGTPINSFSATQPAGGTYHVIDSADLGKQIFLRITATNNGGTSQVDSVPTPPVMMPTLPPSNPNVAVSGGDPNGKPSISGLAVYGSIGAGSGGSVLVGDYGAWQNAVTVIPTWYSCPPANQNCTTPATGQTWLTPSNLTRIGEAYQITAADLGNVLRFGVVGTNISNPSGLSVSSAPTLTVTAYTPTPNLPATAVRTYPAGQDVGPGAPTCAPEPADAPDSGGTTWYVNALTTGPNPGDTPTATYGGVAGGSGTNTATGTQAHPFNSLKALFDTGVPGYSHVLVSTSGSNLTPKANYINPGDRVIVEGGDGTTIADYGTISTYNGFQNTDGGGNTKYIKIMADPSSTTPPVIDGLSVSGSRGLDFKGFTFRPYAANKIVSVSQVQGATTFATQDIMVTDGLISPWNTMTDAINAYNAACVSPGTCAQADFPDWASANSALGVAVSGGSCVAIDNNIIQLTNGSLQIQSIYPRSILIEGNEMKYTLFQDFVDYSNSATIFHNNYEHDPVGGISATGVHVDGFQSQWWNNLSAWGLYGMVMQGNIQYAHTTTDGAILAAFPDQKHCPGSTCSYVGTMSGEEGTGNYYVGSKRINNVMVNGGDGAHSGAPSSSMSVYANNTFLADGNGPAAAAFGGVSNSDYVANNVTNNWSCPPVALTSAWYTNLGVPWGSPQQPAGSLGPTCPAGITLSSATASPVVSWTPWNNGNAVNPATINLHPVAGGVLKNTGTPGNGAPTIDITGAARSATAPSIGAYE